VKHLITGLLLAGFLLQPAFAQTAGEEPEEVVVRGVLPGPPLWRISNGEHVLWIFGYVSPIPKDMQWESARVENVVSRAQAYLPVPDVDVSVSPLVALNPINIFRGVRLAKRLSSNEDDKTLADVLPAELHQRYLAIKTRYFPRNNELDGQRPLVAGQNLAELVQDEEELGSPRDILRKIDRLAKGQRGVKVINTDYSMRISGGYRALADRAEALADGITLEKELECFEWHVGRIETDMEAMKSRANSWALGYVDEFINAPLLRGDDDPCFNLMMASSETQTITELIEKADLEWLAAAEMALAEYDTTLAVLHIRELLNEGGLLAKLKARGYSVREPN